MPDNIKIFLVALALITSGVLSAHNAKWVRDGATPFWTIYLTSLFNGTIYGYLVKSKLFSLTYTSVFQIFLFHVAWYLTTLFWIGELVSVQQIFGLILILCGMILLTFK